MQFCAYVDSSKFPAKSSLQQPSIKTEKLDDDDVIVVGEEISEEILPDIEGSPFDIEAKQLEELEENFAQEEGTCNLCEIVFRRKKDLLSHLKKVHVTQPSLVLDKLPNTHPKVRRLLLKRQPSNDGLKMKIRSLGSEQFQVIQEETQVQQPSLRILKPNEMKWSPPSTDIKREKQEPIEDTMQNNHSPYMSPNMSPYPPQEGFGPNNTDDILKKLLEEQREPPFHMNDSFIQHHPHPHQIQHHPHQQGPPQMENEFISIENLGNMCSVCQCHFPDRMELETHKRMTGHDMHMREPPPLVIMGNQQQIRFQVQAPRPPLNWHPGRPPMLSPTPFIRPGGPGPGQMQMGHSPGPMRPQYTHHPPSGHPYTQQPIRVMHPTRAPMTPMYRVPVSIGQQLPQQNQPQGMQRPQHRPLFQMTSTAPRQSIFLKSRLQKAVNVSPINGDGNGTFAIHPQQAVLSNQTAIRPRFLSPPAPAPNQFQSVAVPMGSGGAPPHLKEESNTPSPKLPKIQSVHSGVILDDLHFDQPSDEPPPTRTSDDMANVLVQRGITITRNKPSSNGVVIKTEPQTETSDAYFTCPEGTCVETFLTEKGLQRHMEIVHQKEPAKSGQSQTDKLQADMGEGRFTCSQEDSIMTCPVSTCNEKFLTDQGLQRHVERVHKKEPVKVIVKGGPPIPTHDKPQTISIKNGLILKSFKCSMCTAHFTSQQGLSQHQAQHLREDIHNPRNASPQSPMLKATLTRGSPIPNEVGIPLVDLSNPVTREKLANLGIFNFIPVANRDLAAGGFFGFPVVSLQGASNPSICNLGELGASSILSIGPVRQIPRKSNSH